MDKQASNFLGKRNKQNIFEDNEEENLQLLTHNGKAIDDLDEHELKQGIDSDEDLDEIDQEMLDKLRFGGFDEEDDFAEDGEDAEGRPQKKKKSRKEVYEEIIKKSKKAKADRQQQKEDNAELVADLDDRCKDIQTIFSNNGTKKLKTDYSSANEIDEYAMLAEKLTFDRLLAPKIEKKIKTDGSDHFGRKKKNVTEIEEEKESDDEDNEAGVEELGDGLKKNRKFRDNKNMKNQKQLANVNQTMDYLKGLAGVVFFGINFLGQR